MNVDQASQPTERVSIGKRISGFWNSRNKIARLTILATAGLVLQCCCLIIPVGNSVAAQSNVGVNTMARSPLIQTALSISANTEFDNHGNERIACKNFNSPTADHDFQRVMPIQLDGSGQGGRSCKSLP